MIVKTYCARMDHGGCGILAHVESGKITKIEGDPDSPISKGYICAKGLAQIERLNHPDRLLYPMKRMGEKGEGKWKHISWDEALDTIAGKIWDRPPLPIGKCLMTLRTVCFISGIKL